MIDLSEFFRITGLALADSINPCAIAVLTMILMSILIKNPGKKEKVLYAGLSFILAVYVGYLFYGIIIVQFFKSFAEVLRDNSSFVFNGLAIFSMIIGALNIKDYFLYYNLVFVLPMLIIVGIIYFGFVKVDEVSGWKESNIRLLHLIAGVLLFVVGFSLLIGWL